MVDLLHNLDNLCGRSSVSKIAQLVLLQYLVSLKRGSVHRTTMVHGVKVGGQIKPIILLIRCMMTHEGLVIYERVQRYCVLCILSALSGQVSSLVHYILFCVICGVNVSGCGYIAIK